MGVDMCCRKPKSNGDLANCHAVGAWHLWGQEATGMNEEMEPKKPPQIYVPWHWNIQETTQFVCAMESEKKPDISDSKWLGWKRRLRRPPSMRDYLTARWMPLWSPLLYASHFPCLGGSHHHQNNTYSHHSLPQRRLLEQELALSLSLSFFHALVAAL